MPQKNDVLEECVLATLRGERGRQGEKRCNVFPIRSLKLGHLSQPPSFLKTSNFKNFTHHQPPSALSPEGDEGTAWGRLEFDAGAGLNLMNFVGILMYQLMVVPQNAAPMSYIDLDRAYGRIFGEQTSRVLSKGYTQFPFTIFQLVIDKIIPGRV